MVTATASWALAEATEDNIVTVSHQLQAKDIEIARLKLELEKSRKKVATPVINNVPVDNFLGCARVAKDQPHLVQLEFYSKVADFLELFVKIQTHVQEGKNYQVNN